MAPPIKKQRGGHALVNVNPSTLSAMVFVFQRWIFSTATLSSRLLAFYGGFSTYNKKERTRHLLHQFVFDLGLFRTAGGSCYSTKKCHDLYRLETTAHHGRGKSVYAELRVLLLLLRTTAFWDNHPLVRFHPIHFNCISIFVLLLVLFQPLLVYHTLT